MDRGFLFEFKSVDMYNKKDNLNKFNLISVFCSY